ncbi:hypothetical protein [Streptomyces achromogenes]|uniref:hypothetical protein n=1 Tax=Streptomyces achromogenes TaxID=67255 RepID=UPI0036C55254
MPQFQITTVSGVDYVEGVSRRFECFGRTETLTGYDFSGDYVDLHFSGGLTVSVPEAQIAHIITA